MRVDPIIRQIVDRCHVGQSNLSIVREVLSRVAGGRKAFFVLAPEIRRVTIHQAVAQHRENVRLYQRVVGGRV